jgi:2-oxoglutarate/2-oxoacid ferredoxin oxidoreductase subunit alpha
LRDAGRSVATIHMAQVWPILPEKLLGLLRKAQQVACVESNATGQLAGLIRHETGFNIEKRVLRYDGLPMTPEFVLREFV